MATIQQQYEQCILAQLRNGYIEQAARAICRNHLLRLAQDDAVRRGLPAPSTIALSDDNEVIPPWGTAEPEVPGVVNEPTRPARCRRKTNAEVNRG